MWKYIAYARKHITKISLSKDACKVIHLHLPSVYECVLTAFLVIHVLFSSWKSIIAADYLYQMRYSQWLSVWKTFYPHHHFNASSLPSSSSSSGSEGLLPWAARQRKKFQHHSDNHPAARVHEAPHRSEMPCRVKVDDSKITGTNGAVVWTNWQEYLTVFYGLFLFRLIFAT